MTTTVNIRRSGVRGAGSDALQPLLDQAEAARDAAIEAKVAAEVVAASFTATQTLGRPSGATLVVGSTSAGNLWHIIGTPLTGAPGTPATTLRLWQGTAGNLTLAFWYDTPASSLFTKVGDDLVVAISDLDAAGTIDLSGLGFVIPEGATNWGFLPSASGVVRYAAATADGIGFWRAAGTSPGNVSSFSDPTLDTSIQPQISIDFVEQVVSVAKLQQLQTSVNAISEEAYTNNITKPRAQLIFNEWYGKPVRALRHPAAVASGQAARERSRAVLDRCRAARTTTVYARRTATGTGDGSSWTNAFTTLDAAFDACVDGSLLLTSSDEANPFPKMLDPCALDLKNIEWRRDLGPEGETWVSGANKGTWTDRGGGVWSITTSLTVKAVAYDLKRDDQAGTVTGINLTNNTYLTALQEQLRGTPWRVSDAVAWYGALTQEAAPTTTPAEGKWSQVGTELYINPPGAPSGATVNANAIFTDNTSAVVLSGACQDWYCGGKLTTFFTPVANAGGEGYGVRFVEGRDIVDQGMRSILSGYHSWGCAGSSGEGNILLDHLAVGFADSGIPLVFYTDAGDLPDAKHMADKCTIMGFGLLTGTGVPLEANFATKGFYQHTDGTDIMTGSTVSRLAIFDFSSQIATKSGVANTTNSIGVMWATNLGETQDAFDPDSLNVEFHGIVILGKQAVLPARCEVDGFYVSGMGFGTGSGDQFSLNTNSGGSTSFEFLLQNGYWETPLYNRVLTSESQTGVDHLVMDDVVLNIRGNYFGSPSGVNNNGLSVKNCLIACGTGALSTLNETVWPTTTKNIDSRGGNIWCGRTADEALVVRAATSEFLTVAEVLAIIDTAKLDVRVTGLNLTAS